MRLFTFIQAALNESIAYDNKQVNIVQLLTKYSDKKHIQGFTASGTVHISNLGTGKTVMAKDTFVGMLHCKMRQQVNRETSWICSST